MVIHTGAEIPLRSESLDEALREFAAFVGKHLTPSESSEISIAANETGAQATAVLAKNLPDDTKEFGFGLIPAGPTLTAAQFLKAVAQTKPKKTRAQIRFSAGAVPDFLKMLHELSEAVPASGRGMMLLIHLTGWQIAGDSSGATADSTFSRFRHGAHDLSANLNLRFNALSLKDPVVKETIASVSSLVHLEFGKPMAAFGGAPIGGPLPQTARVADPRLEPPSPEAQLVVLQTFYEALARTSDDIGARTEDLDNIPFLFSRSGGFDKRMRDVMADKKEKINLPAQLRRFMKEGFPHYLSDAADAEQLWFRRSVAPTLDLLLMFDKVHQWGLGKTFSIALAVDFPNTPFGGMYTGYGGTSRNLFWLFHEDWERQVWAYTTAAELAAALEACGALLRRVLPAFEDHCRKLLLPTPATLPAGIKTQGALSAREAYAHVLPMARKWAADIQLQAASSSNILSLRGQTGSISSSIERTGRLRPQGSWGFNFISKNLDQFCYFVVPHTGRMWWNFHPVLQGAIPKYSLVLETDDWADSTVVAPRAFEAVEKQLESYRPYDISLALRNPQRYSGEFVWEAGCIAYGKTKSERRDVTVVLDRRTGEVSSISVR